jgi:hypothetical protein
VTGTAAATEAVDATRTAYEQLRGHVLAGRAVAGDAGALVLLVREGCAAWLERRTTADASAPMAVGERCEGAPLAAEDVRASVVHVLASMAMAHGGERRRSR